MVREGIVLGHRITRHGIEVDKAKVDVIEKLPPPISVKGVRAFWATSVSTEDSSRTSLKLLNPYANYWRRTRRLNFMRSA